MRKDIFSDRWVIVVDGDGLQPTDFHFEHSSSSFATRLIRVLTG
jgi:hypothetical protein